MPTSSDRRSLKYFVLFFLNLSLTGFDPRCELPAAEPGPDGGDQGAGGAQQGGGGPQPPGQHREAALRPGDKEADQV